MAPPADAAEGLMRWELWSTNTIAERVGLSRRYVEEKVVARPDFPAPLRPGGGRPRWVAAEVIEWFERWRAA